MNLKVDIDTSFTIERNSTAKTPQEREQLLQNPVFGRVFTDHMVTIEYTEELGWHNAKVQPYRSFQIDPSSMVLHYGLEIFEGMKAYRLPNGGAALFRPEENARRLQNSARRLAMVELPEELFIKAVEQLVCIDKDWIPTSEGASLYLRPFMIGSEVALGTKPSNKYIFCVVASPVGTYFKKGASAVSIWVSENYTRAALGGTGAAKCGGNYAASLIAQAEGIKEGCDQVVFLDAKERKWIEELGAMNIFFVFKDGTILTPPLTGTILPGITRNSLIKLARSMGYIVKEELYSVQQWQEDAKSGYLKETFACGTAAVVTPIGKVKGKNFQFSIGDGGAGVITERLKTALTDIQFGRSIDVNHWLHRVF